MIEAAAPGTARVVVPRVAGGEATTVTGRMRVSMPAAANGALTLSSSTGQADEPVVVTLSLPVSGSGDRPVSGRLAKDGTMVYQSDSGDGSDVAVQALSDGSVRVQTVARSEASRLAYTYEVGGATPMLQPDGSISLIRRLDSASLILTVTVGTIEPAWAVDAKGRPVDTHYEVTSAGKLVQVVSPGPGTKFPVVSDPKVTVGWSGWIVDFNRAETKLASSTYAALANLLVSAVTTVGGFFATILGLTTNATVMMIGGLVAVYGGLILVIASGAYAQGRCLRMFMGLYPLPGNVPIPASYSGGYCK